MNSMYNQFARYLPLRHYYCLVVQKVINNSGLIDKIYLLFKVLAQVGGAS